jgi:hypothetical protein
MEQQDLLGELNLQLKLTCTELARVFRVKWGLVIRQGYIRVQHDRIVDGLDDAFVLLKDVVFLCALHFLSGLFSLVLVYL